MANDLTLIGSTGSNCGHTQFYELTGCADCVPYKKLVPLSECACPADEIKYLNLETGSLSTVEPTGFTIGACDSGAEGKVCYQLNDGATDILVSVVRAKCCVTYYENNVEVTNATRINVLKGLIADADCDAVVDCVLTPSSRVCYEIGTDSYSVVTVNNVTTYYKNGVKLTVAADIIAAQTAVAGATADNVVDCNEVPDSKVCYRGAEQTVFRNKFATRFTRASEGATTPQYISRIQLNYSPADTFCSLLDFAPNAIQYWTGSAYVDPAVLKSQLQSRGLLALVQGCEPKIDNWAVTIEGGQLVFRFWSTENDYTAQSFYFRVSFSGNASGSPYGTVLFGSSQDTFSVPETVGISIKSLNGVLFYYQDGVEVTDPARIAEIEALIGTLGPDDIVCCPDCVTEPLNVLTDPQATPTTTGNTNNLNSVFKDLGGNTWIVDSNGDAVMAGSVANPLNVLTTVQPTPTAAGNTNNLNSVFKDANGDTWIVDSNGDAVMAGSVANPLNVLTTVQPTPTATGNTTNPNSVFKDANGDTWIVDSNGDAILVETPPPDGQVCYEFTDVLPPVTQTYAVAECLEFFNGNAGVPYYLTQIRLRGASSGATLGTINFSPALQVWNGSTRITPAAFITALNNAGYLAAVQAVDPRIDRFDVVQTSNSNRIYAFDNQNLITTSNRVFAHTSDYSLSSTGTPISGTLTNGNYTDITSTYTPNGATTTGYRVVTVNGDTTYYKDDVELTAAADITAAQTAIAGATADNVVDCGGSSVACQALMDTQTFIATAGQTTFTLIKAPSGDIVFSRNGMVINDAAASVTGTTVTYVPAQNSNQAMVAGDRVEIAYVYNVCTGGATPTIVDGSETKVIAGTGTTVTGAGTAGNPYVVSTTATPESVTYGTAVPTATAVAGDRYFITSNGTRTGIVGQEYVHDGTGWVRVPISAASSAGTIKGQIANRGVDVVSLDGLFKVRMNPGGSTLQIATISGSFVMNGSTTIDYAPAAAQTLHQVRTQITINTTYQNVNTTGWGIGSSGGRQVLDFMDSTNLRHYRVTMIVNNGYLNNVFTIERLI